jgi:hypothetical protein
MTTNSAAAEPALLTPRDAARSLALCEKTLYLLTQPRGPIPVVRIGRAVRYDRRDLERFVSEQKSNAERERP